MELGPFSGAFFQHVDAFSWENKRNQSASSFSCRAKMKPTKTKEYIYLKSKYGQLWYFLDITLSFKVSIVFAKTFYQHLFPDSTAFTKSKKN